MLLCPFSSTLLVLITIFLSHCDTIALNGSMIRNTVVKEKPRLDAETQKYEYLGTSFLRCLYLCPSTEYLD